MQLTEADFLSVIESVIVGSAGAAPRVGGAPDSLSGSFVLTENPAFLRTVFERLAQQTDAVPSFERYLHFVTTLAKDPYCPKRPDFLPERVRTNGPFAGVHISYLLRLNDFQENIAPKLTANTAGYIYAVTKFHVHFDTDFWTKKRFRLPQILAAERERHTLITGQPGSGKSYLIKWLIYDALRRPNPPAIVVVDPHGELVSDIARMRIIYEKFQDRLILIDPSALNEYGKTPVFNPFFLKDRSPAAINDASQQFLEVFREMLEGDFSRPMETVLRQCLPHILRRDNAALLDLYNIVDSNDSAGLVAYAKENATHETDRQFFEYDFPSKGYEPTRVALRQRLQIFFSSPIFRNTFGGTDNSFDLEEAIKNRSIILFSCSKGKMGPSDAGLFSRFILASLYHFGMQQEKVSKEFRTPVELYIDELPLVVTPSIDDTLENLRKYRVSATLATQNIEQIDAKKTQQAVLASTAVKIMGENGANTQKILSKATGIEESELLALPAHSFIGYTRKMPAHLRFSVGSELSDPRASIHDDEFRELFARQLERYYRASHEMKGSTVDVSTARDIATPEKKPGLFQRGKKRKLSSDID